MEIVTQSATSDVVEVQERATQSAVSWGAVLGGAFVGAAFYLILLALGAGFELAVVSPWSTPSATATKLEAGAILWLVFSQVIASALGGYLTGRLRSKWAWVHSDEIHFRDTANGFLSWAVALVLSVCFLLSTVASVLAPRQGAVRSTAEPVAAASGANSRAYFVDKLFRSERIESEKNDTMARAEADRILAKGIHQEQFPAPDQDYLVRLTAARSGVNQTEAARRVSEVIAEIREYEETAQKIAGRLLLWTFLALMMGAFSASFAATIGGRHRDHLHPV